MINNVGNSFEHGFLAIPRQAQIARCNEYKLAFLLITLFKDNRLVGAPVITLTSGLFSSVLKTLGADCVCDVGSRDGDESLLLRPPLSDAVVLAFEANSINYQIMAPGRR
jgi:hypothetical protein